MSWWGHCRESFSVKFIVHYSWYTPLIYVFMNLSSNVIFCVCSLVFFSHPDVNITWITGHIERSIVDKIDPTSEYVEMVKFTISITLGCIFFLMRSDKCIYRYFNWSVNNTFDEPCRGPPNPLYVKNCRRLMMKFVLENCLLDLFIVLDLDLEPIWIDIYLFLSLKSWS